MSDGVTVTGLYEVVAEFETASAELLPEVRKVVAKGALNIKTDWRREWAGIRHAPRLPSSITYDTRITAKGAVKAEIGPEDGPDRQGFLGPIIEFGGTHSAPHPGGSPALDREAPRFQAALEAVTRRLTP